MAGWTTPPPGAISFCGVLSFGIWCRTSLPRAGGFERVEPVRGASCFLRDTATDSAVPAAAPTAPAATATIAFFVEDCPALAGEALACRVVAIFEPAREAEELEVLTFCVDFADEAFAADFAVFDAGLAAGFAERLAAEADAGFGLAGAFAAGRFALAAGRDDFAADLLDFEPDLDAVRVAADFVAFAITHSRGLRAQNQHVERLSCRIVES